MDCTKPEGKLRLDTSFKSTSRSSPPNNGRPEPINTGTVVITISVTNPSRRNDCTTRPPST
ncbi:hypothetical protein D3C76_1563150 [compost metagenome]